VTARLSSGQSHRRRQRWGRTDRPRRCFPERRFGILAAAAAGYLLAIHGNLEFVDSVWHLYGKLFFKVHAPVALHTLDRRRSRYWLPWTGHRSKYQRILAESSHSAGLSTYLTSITTLSWNSAPQLKLPVNWPATNVQNGITDSVSAEELPCGFVCVGEGDVVTLAAEAVGVPASESKYRR
jgi:hypothetical protein